MSYLSELFKTRKEYALNKYFEGGINFESNKYFTFNQVLDDDHMIIITHNIRMLTNKEGYVLVVGSNKVVYLKGFQLQQLHNKETGVNAWAIKLNRNYFKVYTWSFDINGFEGKEEEDTFDSLMEVAKEQNNANYTWSFGFR